MQVGKLVQEVLILLPRIFILQQYLFPAMRMPGFPFCKFITQLYLQAHLQKEYWISWWILASYYFQEMRSSSASQASTTKYQR